MFSIISPRSVLLQPFAKPELKTQISEVLPKFSVTVLHKPSPRNSTLKATTGSMAPNQGWE